MVFLTSNNTASGLCRNKCKPIKSTHAVRKKYLKLTFIVRSVMQLLKRTRTVRKSDYTPAFALPKHMAGILDEKCKEKEKDREEQIGECPFAIPQYNLLLQASIPNLKFLS